MEKNSTVQKRNLKRWQAEDGFLVSQNRDRCFNVDRITWIRMQLNPLRFMFMRILMDVSTLKLYSKGEDWSECCLNVELNHKETRAISVVHPLWIPAWKSTRNRKGIRFRNTWIPSCPVPFPQWFLHVFRYRKYLPDPVSDHARSRIKIAIGRTTCITSIYSHAC